MTRDMIQINKNSPLPLYYQLKQEIINLIKSDELQEGDKLPSERELCQYHGVSRMTVNKAIKQLVQENYLYREQGKGTFVARKHPGYTISPLVSFTAEMEDRGLSTATRVLGFERLTPDSEASEKLQLKKQQEIYLIKRLRLVEGAPFLLEQVHLPVQQCPELQSDELENNSLYQVLKDKYYHQLSYAEATVEPVKLKGNPAHRLEVEPGSLGLLFYQTTFLKKGRPIEWTRAYYRSQDHKFSFKFGERLVNNQVFKEV